MLMSIPEVVLFEAIPMHYSLPEEGSSYLRKVLLEIDGGDVLASADQPIMNGERRTASGKVHHQ